MAAQAERLKISITEENRAIRALQEAAYIKGYMTAELRERERRKKARERRKRKRYFLTQKLYGVAMLKPWAVCDGNAIPAMTAMKRMKLR